MLISRGNFTKIAAGSAIVLASGLRVQDVLAALPTSVTPDQLDEGADADLKIDPTTKKGQVKHRVHEKGPATTPFLTDGYKNIGGTKYNGAIWGGQTHVIIDEQGNWLFGGSFPSTPNANEYPTVFNVATGIALSSAALGQAFAWTAQGQLNQWKPDGTRTIIADWSFQKQGNAPVIANLWKYAVKGHKFVGSTSWVPVPDPKQPSSGGGGSSILGDVKDALGAIGSIFSFL